MSHIMHRCCHCLSCCYPCQCIQNKIKAIDDQIRQLQWERSRLLGYGHVFAPTVVLPSITTSWGVSATTKEITCDDVIANAKKQK